jgi:homoserine dehydrogenase
MLFKAILVGYGKIGQDLSSLIQEKSSELREKYALEVKIVGALDSSGGVVAPLGLDAVALNQVKRKTGRLCDFPRLGRIGLSVREAIEETDESNLLIEMTPTNFKNGQPGISNILTAIENNLNVVTTNKGALALAFPLLKKAADKAGVSIKYSGAAANPLPPTELETYSSLGVRITEVEAVVNACTNFILARMQQGVTKIDAIAEANSLGLLESNPSVDLDGWDTACKLVITANMLLNANVTLTEVEKITALSHIDMTDAKMANENNQVLKHRGMLDASGQKLRIISDVKSYPRSHMFSHLRGPAKAMKIKTRNAGSFDYMSEQTGSLPSARAVLHDLLYLRDQTR